MSELDQYRAEIDEIDKKIVELYERRMAVTEKVASYKIREGKRVLDPEREKAKIASVEALTHNDFNRHGVQELFEQIMAMSRKKQYQLVAESGSTNRLPFIPVDSLTGNGSFRVVYQGAPGSYSEAAMKQFFGPDVKNVNVQTFRDAMSAVDEGSADFAVLPIENSTAGTVAQTYDLLTEYENYIVGEQIIPIRHCLMSVEGATEETIRTVYSHAQSLMQSEHFLSGHPEWQQVSMQNNAFAAQKVARDKDITEAAIASKYAAEAYGLKIIREGVNQSESNSTRFIICTNQKIFLRGAKKISLSFEVKHESGSLYHALSHFIYNDLNMNRLESRPIEGRNWEYRFFVDFDGNLEEPGVKNAIRGLRDETMNMQILGNY